MIRLLYFFLLQVLIISAQNGDQSSESSTSTSDENSSEYNTRQSTIKDARLNSNCVKCNVDVPDKAVQELSHILAHIIRDFLYKHCKSGNCREKKLKQLFHNSPVYNLDGSRRFGSSEEYSPPYILKSLKPKYTSMPATESTTNCTTNIKQRSHKHHKLHSKKIQLEDQNVTNPYNARKFLEGKSTTEKNIYSTTQPNSRDVVSTEKSHSTVEFAVENIDKDNDTVTNKVYTIPLLLNTKDSIQTTTETTTKLSTDTEEYTKSTTESGKYTEPTTEHEEYTEPTTDDEEYTEPTTEDEEYTEPTTEDEEYTETTTDDEDYTEPADYEDDTESSTDSNEKKRYFSKATTEKITTTSYAVRPLSPTYQQATPNSIEISVPSTTTERINTQDIEKKWTDEFKSTSSDTTPKIQDVHDIYKEGLIYLTENPNATTEDLKNNLPKSKDKHYEGVIDLLKEIKDKDQLKNEYEQVVNSNDDKLKYKTAIAFLKVRQKGNREKNNSLINLMEQRARSLQEEKKSLMAKLLSIGDEYSKLQSAYGKIVKEAGKDTDKVVVAVMKFPVKKENEAFNNDQVNKVINKVKEKYTHEQDYEIIAPETVKVVKNAYILSDDKKSNILSAAKRTISQLTDSKISSVHGFNLFNIVINKLPKEYLNEEDIMFKLNPYQEYERNSTQLNPTQSLKTLRANIRQMFLKKSRGEIDTPKQTLFNNLIQILYLLIDRVESNSTRPHVSVYSMEQKPKRR